MLTSVASKAMEPQRRPVMTTSSVRNRTALVALAALAVAAATPTAASPYVLPKGPVIKLPPNKPLPPVGPKKPGGWGGHGKHHWHGASLGFMSGMALGALASSSAGAYPVECYIVRRKVVDQYGDLYIRKVRVCE